MYQTWAGQSWGLFSVACTGMAKIFPLSVLYLGFHKCGPIGPQLSEIWANYKKCGPTEFIAGIAEIYIPILQISTYLIYSGTAPKNWCGSLWLKLALTFSYVSVMVLWYCNQHYQGNIKLHLFVVAPLENPRFFSISIWPLFRENLPKKIYNYTSKGCYLSEQFRTFYFLPNMCCFVLVSEEDKSIHIIKTTEKYTKNLKFIYRKFLTFETWITWNVFRILAWHENHSLAFSKIFLLIPNTPGFGEKCTSW